MTENKTKVSEELSKAGETSLITPLAAEALPAMARLRLTPLTRTTSSAIPRILTALGNGISENCSAG